MNLLIISDLHIGTNDHFETFGWKADEFILALEKIRTEEKIDRIILNGDVFELYKYSFEEICHKNPEIINYLLKDPCITYIKGNHDAVCPYGTNSLEFINTEGKSIYIEHGHCADFLNGTRLGRKIQTLGFNLLRFGIKNKFIFKTYKRIVLFNEAVNRIPKKYDSIKYLTHALRLLKNYDMVILGHTHKIESHKTYYSSSKKHYINSGTCSMGRFQGIIVNTNTMKYETLKFKNLKELLKDYRKSKPIIRELALTA
ncbi:MAG: hypothetical protein EA393_04085 [Bacteroidetes bacterium]|nr:MAG: hypothetical protein EA393_04085 [Bacteroidota bacterium]